MCQKVREIVEISHLATQLTIKLLHRMGAKGKISQIASTSCVTKNIFD